MKIWDVLMSNSSKLGMQSSRDSRKFKKKFTSPTLLSLSTQHSDDSATSYHLIVVVSAAVLSFCGNIDGGFVFDDREAILKNKAVRSAQELLRTDFWGQPIRSSNSHKSFRPVTTLTFGLVFLLNFGEALWLGRDHRPPIYLSVHMLTFWNRFETSLWKIVPCRQHFLFQDGTAVLFTKTLYCPLRS